MENFTFIQIFIDTLFNNEGLRSYLVYIIATLGVYALAKVATIGLPRIMKK